MTGGSTGFVARLVGSLHAPVSWVVRRPAFCRLLLIFVVAALLIAGLAARETQEILFKGSIL